MFKKVIGIFLLITILVVKAEVFSSERSVATKNYVLDMNADGTSEESSSSEQEEKEISKYDVDEFLHEAEFSLPYYFTKRVLSSEVSAKLLCKIESLPSPPPEIG